MLGISRLKVLIIIFTVVSCEISSPTTKNKNMVNNDSNFNDSLTANKILNSQVSPIPIKWVDNLKGDFEFTKMWSYKEGIYRNSFGQLSCDGFCPERTDNMKDVNGEIIKDSLTVFYQLVDTTHQFHTLHSIINNEEKPDVNFITATKVSDSIFTLITTQNSHIYGGLKIVLTNSKCFSEIEVISPNLDIGTQYYKLQTGSIYLEKKALNKGIIKSKFNFTYELDSQNQIEWKGLIYVNIE